MLKKTPGFDGIQNIILKKLPSKAITFKKNCFNGLYPSHFKRAKVVVIPTPGKDPKVSSSFDVEYPKATDFQST